MNLSAPFISEHFKKPMRAALPYVDILFGNETEAEAFSKANDLGTMDRKEIALKISNMEKINSKRKRIVIITQGCDPVILVKDNTITEFPVTKLPEEKLVDTNGAGDAFVGGTRYLSNKNKIKYFFFKYSSSYIIIYCFLFFEKSMTVSICLSI